MMYLIAKSNTQPKSILCFLLQEHHVRENFIAELSQKFNDVGLVYSRGGQISFDIYPRGWNKRYCLDHIDSDGFEDIHFFGDRCEPVCE